MEGTDTVVNEHTRVTAEIAAGATQIVVADGSIFAVGDLLLVWQSGGASGTSSGSSAESVDLSATPVGRFELARLIARSGNTLTVRDPMLAAFSANTTQALYVPEYSEAVVSGSGSIVAPAWDPVTRSGGIVAFFVSGALENNGLVSASGRGGRGGVFVNGSSTDNCTQLDQNAPAGAQKGEGLTGSYGASFTGRGNLLNAGGGGVCAESGGAGGALAGIGGFGGGSRNGRNVGGVGGRAIASVSLEGRLLMGAGGGAGHGDSNSGGAGGAGGGVVLVRAGSLDGSGFFNADGATGGAALNDDGAGGGGSGGSVLVQVEQSASCAIRALGANGGGANANHGAGGGGGGGRALARMSSGSCSVQVSGGAAGVNGVMATFAAAAGASGSSTSATPGLDIDADDDGIRDAFDGTSDPDLDTIAAYLDPDDDNDGVPTLDEGAGDGSDVAQDTDGDDELDYLDTDDDGDLVPTAAEDLDDDGDPRNDHSDDDEVPNYLDDDDDGDSIATLAEDPNDNDDPLDDDTDGDGLADFVDADDDDDGLLTRFEDVNGDLNPLNDDSDLDALPNYRDDDDDNDHVLTLDEDVDGDSDPRSDDTDGDSTPDYLDVDDDGDGVQTRVEDISGDGAPGNDDTDGDGTPNYLDADDDGDGVPSIDEDSSGNGTPRDDDFDGDLIPDFLDDDDDNDGVLSIFEDRDGDGSPANDDTDEDGKPDYLDDDDDDDGLLTANEAPDANGDGDPADARNTELDGARDYLDPDDDGDGIPTKSERPDPNKNGADDDARDTDGDGKPDYLDDDDDDDGVKTRDERSMGHDRDTDIDGDPDHLDDDDDDDGLLTIEERPNRRHRDTDGDGIADHVDDDDDNDGRGTASELRDSETWGADLDDDGVACWLDDDSDGDGALDIVENALTGDINQDGRPDYLDPSIAAGDRDDDGVPDFVECPAQHPCPDHDGDGRADLDDTDDDDDGVSTRDERPEGVDVDSDGDGTPDHLDPDDDGDGLLTRDERSPEGDVDSDDDGVPDHLDEDDDGDGIATAIEQAAGADDFDGDGIPNWLDTDSDDDGYSDADEIGEDGDSTFLDPTAAPDDPDGDGLSGTLECGGERCPDTDDDGIPDDEDDDDDGDGLSTVIERPNGMNVDTDDDGIPDHLDRDDDGDSVDTLRERTDTEIDDLDGDDSPNWHDQDDDGDGLTTRRETEGGPGRDTDGDDLPNYLDDDDDGDGRVTALEIADGERYVIDPDRDYMPSYLDFDSDNDGLLDSEESAESVDGVTPPDYLRPGGIVGGAVCSGVPRPTSAPAAWLGALAFLSILRLRRNRRSTRSALSKSAWLVALLGALLSTSACTQRMPRGVAAGALECVDADNDGYGTGCTAGHDCDDDRPDVHTGCRQCAQPAQGCECYEGTASQACFLEQTEDEDGTLLCNEGTRYCRQGAWSGCESVYSYPSPEPDPTALVDPAAAPVYCSDCEINCFVIRDNLDPVDGGLRDAAVGVEWFPSGGIKLAPTTTVFTTDAGYVVDGGVITGPTACVQGVGADSDCDGIVDPIDPYPFTRPFATTNPAIFLDLAPGETGRGVINLQFFMNSLDVYFLLDQTDSMNSVRNKLQGALTTGNFLDPSVECSDTDLDGVPNNELKMQGLLGAVRCMLRNAQFGTGFFREIPFTTYGHNDEVTFRHVLDLTQDTAAAVTAIGSMTIDRDVDWPDAHPLALYSLVTGNGLYMGLNKPGVPPRVGCPEGRWGYSCFRPDAIPVVVMFTDSPMHEGPVIAGRDYSYDPSILTITAGSSLSYIGVPNTHETLPTAFDMGNITGTNLTYSGSTLGMASDYNRGLLTCIANGRDAAPDATFTFSLDAPASVSFSTGGSAFTPAVGIYSHVVETPAEYLSPGGNETALRAFDVGRVTDSWARITGTTAGMQADYPVADIGCGVDSAAPDAVFGFSLSRDALISIDAAGTAFAAAISLHNRAPALIENATTTNQNDTVSLPQELGALNGRIINVLGGDTTAGTIAPTYTEAEIGCTAASASADAVYHFNLTKPTRVHIDTIGSSFDTVLGLADGMLGAQVPLSFPNTADLQANAFDVGDLVRQWYGISGSTATLDANYRQSFIGCNAHTNSPDGVLHFTLSEPTTVLLDSSGSGFDTVLSLHNGVIDPTTPLRTDNNNETADTPMYLGVADDAWFEVFGGDTTPMRADYTDAVIGCGADTLSAEAVFAFDVTSTSTIRADTLGSSFDTVISLHSAPPPRHTTTAIAAGMESFSLGIVNSKSTIFTGSSVGRASDFGGFAMGCGTEDVPSDVVIDFTLDRPTEIEINTEGSDYDTAIGLFPSTVLSPKRPAATAITNTNEARASALSTGVLDGQWKVYSGNTTSMSANFGNFGCDTANAARDAVFKFTLSTPRTVTLDTRGSSTDMVLGLYNDATNAYLGCDDDSGGGTIAVMTQSLAAGTYYVVVKGDRSNDRGAYQLSIRDDVLKNPILCNDDAFVSGRSQLVAQLTAGSYKVVLKGARVGHEGNFAIRFTDRDWFAINNRLACDDNGAGGTSSMIERTLNPGTYYVVVKGDLAVDEGPYMLTVRSVSSGSATSHAITCDNDSGLGTASRISAALPAGEYWVVIKGTQGQSGLFQLEARDIGPGGQGLVLACNDDAVGVGTDSVIERDLSIGHYYVFVKGGAATANGAYKLNVRDANAGGAALTCDAPTGVEAARIERSLTAGDYWVVMKGLASNPSGSYALSIRDSASSARTSYACATTTTGSVNLPAGRFDVVLKGSNNDLAGTYALTLGNGQTQQATFNPPDWDATLAEIQDRNMRVITVLNCHDNGQHGEGRDCNYAKEQAVALAHATDALGPTLQPLVVDIDANGTGLEAAVLGEINSLAGHLEMDVAARVMFEPDRNPGFLVSVEAIDRPGDGCDGLIGIEHQNCRPGATPTFYITITNPLSAPVPLNPNDPNGGYNFRADLIADDKYFVDAVPIYVIPRDINNSVPPPEYVLVSSGSYWQDVASPGCAGNAAPDWRDLFWTADVPTGTSIKFSVCTGSDSTMLAGCALTHIATITGGATCMVDADCVRGFCATGGVCQTIEGGMCTSDAQCASGATCTTDTMRCAYRAQPVYVGEILLGANLQTNLRMNIELNANPTTNKGPTVFDWALTYLCRNVN